MGKREGFRHAFVGGCWEGEAGTRVTRRKASSNGISLGSIFGFSLAGPELEVGAQNRELGSRWPTPGKLLQRCVLPFQSVCRKGCRSEFYWCIWSGHCLCIYSVS